MFCVKMYPAQNGDAFLIKSNTGIPAAILIDGGYASTFQDYILADLSDLSQLHYSLDLVVATHIDADHISGLLSFFKENGISSHPKIIQVGNVWHNSLRSITSSITTDIDMNQDDEDLITEICKRGYPLPKDSENLPAELTARQGSSLAALLLAGGYCWNNGNGTQSISSNMIQQYKINNSLQLHVVNPSAIRLKTLADQWIKGLQRLGFTGKIGENAVFDDAFEFLSAFDDLRSRIINEPARLSNAVTSQLEKVYQADNSITNGSSISFIINAGPSRFLFLGDSWSEDIENYLTTTQNGSFPFIFDMIKISHHGSFHNTSPTLLKLIDSSVFLISTNGEGHGHPNFEVLKAIVGRPSDFKRHLYFNYSTPASKQLRHYVFESNNNATIYENSTEWIEIGRQYGD